MKKPQSLSLFLALAFANPISASGDITVHDRLENPLLIVLDEKDGVYNECIKHAVENYWSLNSFSFITSSQYEDCKNYSDNVFLIKNENQAAEEEGTMVHSIVMRLVYFKKDGKLVTHLAGAPVVDEVDIKVCLINAVRVLQDKLQFILFNENDKDPAFFSYDKNVEFRSDIIKAKKLYIAREDIDGSFSLEEVLSLYDGELNIVSKTELNKLIDSKSPGVLYAVVFNKKTSGVSYVNTKQILSASTGEMIYTNETTSINPQGFTKKDIKNLAE
ncbi:MAG: hypothetical protein H7Y00_08490 [Fimbriimonadaceae bacterium]|nr:hypothetical protein [Chitinophagales bacterium]